MEGRYNIRSPAVKRLMKEAQELSEPTDQYFAQPLEDNLFEWHFTVRGPTDSDFQNGIYHGRIILPVDYPMKPPSIIWLTPNGRFETNKKICLSISGHHPESWQPSWSIRTALLAIIGFMPTHPGGAIGSLDYKPEERKVLAKKSRAWQCPTCGDVSEILLDVTPDSQSTSKEAQELASQISFQGEKSKVKTEEGVKKDEQKEKENQSSENEKKMRSPTSALTPETHSQIASNSDNQQMNNSPVIPAPANNTYNETQAASAPQSPQMFVSTHNTIPSPWNSHLPQLSPNLYAQSTPCSMSSMPPRFPYPPSFYTNTATSFYPPGCALPPGVGMFPCPFPPSYPSQSNIETFASRNNSSGQNSTPERKAQTSMAPVQFFGTHPSTKATQSSETRMRRQKETSGDDKATSSDMQKKGDCFEKQEHKDVLRELLSKVKRVGSEDKVEGNLQSMATEANSKQPDQNNALSVDSGKNGEDCQSEGSLSMRKKNSGGDLTFSEIPPSDNENSEVGVPPIEVSESEQRSAFDKSACSSTTELEKMKSKQQQASKGLRQRQSATVNSRTEGNEEAPDQSNAASGQRIEAASGDFGHRNVFYHDGQGPRANNRIRDAAYRATQRRSPYDFTFFLMIILFISTVGILVNRIVRMHWLEHSPDKPI